MSQITTGFYRQLQKQGRLAWNAYMPESEKLYTISTNSYIEFKLFLYTVE